jgi:hypothetical protein
METIQKSDCHLIDKLRTIRPFTESQLLTLYNNSQLDDNKKFIDNFVEVLIDIIIKLNYFEN